MLKGKKQVLARKSHVCNMCGREIPVGDYLWWYKPIPVVVHGKWKASHWACRCRECEPKHSDEFSFSDEVNIPAWQW